MSLTDEQCAELYAKVIEDNTHLSWIKKRLEKGDAIFEKYESRLQDLEKAHSRLKGKLGAFILGFTFFVTLVINSILWGVSHLSGGK